MKFKSFIAVLIISFMAYTSTITALGSPLEVTFSQEKKVPVIMYHNVLNNKALQGKFVISPDELESDLAYLKEKGYETIFIKDLLSFVEEGEELPDNPIILSFDDGDYAIAHYVLPLLKKYDMKAVVSIIGTVTDDYSSREGEKKYPNLTWQQVNEMIESGYIEIQNHTYDMHKKNGAKKIYKECDEDYKIRLSEDLIKMQERMYEMTGYKANTLAYPYGLISSCSDHIIKALGFKASLSCYERINNIKVGEPDGLFSLGRYLRPHGTTSERFFNKILPYNQ